MTALFHLDSAPDTREGLDQRMIEIKAMIYQARSTAAQTQAMISTIFRTIDHVMKLVDSVGKLLGNQQGNQTIIQVQTTMTKTTAILATQTAAHQRAETVEKLGDAVVIESLNRINMHRLDDHPRY